MTVSDAARGLVSFEGVGWVLVPTAGVVGLDDCYTLFSTSIFTTFT